MTASLGNDPDKPDSRAFLKSTNNSKEILSVILANNASQRFKMGLAHKVKAVLATSNKQVVDHPQVFRTTDNHGLGRIGPPVHPGSRFYNHTSYASRSSTLEEERTTLVFIKIIKGAYTHKLCNVMKKRVGAHHIFAIKPIIATTEQSGIRQQPGHFLTLHASGSR